MKRGWELKKLGEICDLMNGYAFQSKNYTDEGYFVIRIGNVQDGIIELNNARYIQFNEEKQKKFILQSGDILISLTGNVGRVGIINEEHLPAVLNQRVAKISIKNEIKLNKDFIFYFFTSEYFISSLIKAGRGAAQQNISTTDIENLEIPFPTLSEQQQIVTILNEAFAAINKAKANAEQNLKNVKELFESYLQGVFETKGEGWEEKKLIEITNKIGSGATPRGGQANYKTEGISLVRSMNVHDFYFREKNLAFIDHEQANSLSNVTLQEDDVLLNITGASIARCCIIPKRYLPARVNQHVSIIRAKKDIVNPLFLAALLTSKYYKDQILGIGEQGATRQAITKVQLENFKIVFPKTIEEQELVIQKMNVLSSETKKLEVIYQQKIKDLEELKKSMLQKAFAGELKTATVCV